MNRPFLRSNADYWIMVNGQDKLVEIWAKSEAESLILVWNRGLWYEQFIP